MERSLDPFAAALRRNGRSLKAELSDLVASSQLGRRIHPHTNTRILALAFAYADAEEIAGDYAEFGVWLGNTFVDAWRAAGEHPSPRRFVAFDSFEGLPEVSGLDTGGPFFGGQFSFARERFEARLRRARMPADKVHIVEGFFDATLAHPEGIPLERVAVAWIDCDLYASTVPVLDYLTPRLAQGAVMLFDDWFCFRGARDKGEAKACGEWLERNPDISLVPWWQFNWAGQAFLFRREESETPTG